MYRISADSSHTLTILATIGSIGAYLNSGVRFDAAGNLYGTTFRGGTHDSGTVYRIAADASHTLTTLVNFGDSTDPLSPYDTIGGRPFGGVTLDAAGNLYGTTSSDGTVYRISADASHTMTTLAHFDGGNPYAGVTLDAAGNIYGANSQYGTSGHGEVFELVNDAVAVTPEPSTLALGALAGLTALYRKAAARSSPPMTSRLCEQ